MSSELEKELTDLRRALLSMAASAELRVAQSLEALLNRDIGLAQAVRESDDEIDDMDVDIESECLRILALQHPLAKDLRFVLSALRINTDLERIADLARGVAKRVIYMGQQSPVAYPKALAEMAEGAKKNLSSVLRALSEQSATLAEDVRRSDRYVDQKYREFFEWAVADLPRHTQDTRSMIDLLFVARAIERIGDMATNIAEDVIFAVVGSIVRHTKP